MVLKNMENYLKNMALLISGGIPSSITSTTAGKKTLLPLVTTLDETITDFYAITGCRAPFDTNNTLTLSTDQTDTKNAEYSKTYIGLGTGTTPVTENDYKLETQISSGLSLVSSDTEIVNAISLNEDKTELKRVSTLRASVKNIDSEEITINEIGFYQVPNNMHSVLLYREVLDTPVTVGVGAVATFEFTFAFKNQLQ